MTTIRHRPRCESTTTIDRVTGALGDTLERCANCGAFRVVDPAELTQPTTAPHRTASTRPRGRYWCREHPRRPVTWKGTGCPDCQTERTTRRRPKDDDTPPDPWTTHREATR